MKLNLYILQEDLPQWNLQGNPTAPLSVAMCLYPCFFTAAPDIFREDVLYVMPASCLAQSTHLVGNASILSIGHPGEQWLSGNYNLMYTDASADPLALMNDINQRFFFYMDIEQQLQQCLDQNMPMRSLAEVMGELIQKPILAQGSGFKVLFYYFPEFHDPTPSYLKFRNESQVATGANLPDEWIRTLVFDSAYNDAAVAKAPTMWTSEFWEFPCLFQNIFIEGEAVARIIIDEIPTSIRNRDHVLIQLLGKYLQKALLRERINPYDRPKGLDEILTDLLNQNPVPEQEVHSVLDSFSWNMYDSYFCAVMRLKEKHWDINALNPVALRLSNYLKSSCYTLIDNSLVYICNVSRPSQSRHTLISEIKPILRDNLVTASFSTVFRNFKDLYYFYQQALEAGRLGAKKDPTFWYFKFEDYQNDFLLEQYTKNTIVDTLIPQGLRDLMDHDKRKGTSYASLLKIYLDQERSIINTVRASYTSRSTFIYQIQRVQEILQMDLEDPEVRLLLMMVFRVLEKKNEDAVRS